MTQEVDMAHPHFTEDELHEAIDRYREALTDALDAAEPDTARDELVRAARILLDEEDGDAHTVIVTLADSEYGDQVWRLEEEILDEDDDGELLEDDEE